MTKVAVLDDWQGVVRSSTDGPALAGSHEGIAAITVTVIAVMPVVAVSSIAATIILAISAWLRIA